MFLCTKFLIYLPLFFFLSFLDFLPSDRAPSSLTGSAEQVTKETDLSSYDHLFFLPQVAVRELGSNVESLQVKVQVCPSQSAATVSSNEGSPHPLSETVRNVYLPRLTNFQFFITNIFLTVPLLASDGRAPTAPPHSTVFGAFLPPRSQFALPFLTTHSAPATLGSLPSSHEKVQRVLSTQSAITPAPIAENSLIFQCKIGIMSCRQL